MMKIKAAKIHFPVHNSGKRKNIFHLCHERRLWHKEGYEKAARMLEIVSRMIADGKTDLIPRLKEEETFYQEMLMEYHL